MGYLQSSIFRKQIVALTGLIMISFIIVHLTGNLLLLLGPDVFNGYAEKLRELGALLWLARLGLIAAVVLHVYYTTKLYLENRVARGSDPYAQPNTKGTEAVEFAKKTMILTGLLVFFFIWIHLFDFTFVDKTGERSVIGTELGAESLGLYGIVWNSFTNPLRVLFYIAAVCSVGMHLTHGFESFFQTLGFRHEWYTAIIAKLSVALGVAVAAGYSLIPLYVMFFHYVLGRQGV